MLRLEEIFSSEKSTPTNWSPLKTSGLQTEQVIYISM